MPITSCKGDENRRKIHRDYEITPLIHTRLGVGDTKAGCCGPLTTFYYAIQFEKRNDPRDTGIVYAGKDCAEKLLNVFRKPHLELRNPFVIELVAPPPHDDAPNGQRGTPNDRGVGGRPRAQITALNAEIKLAVVIMISWMNDTRANGPIADTMAHINERPDIDVPHSYVKAISTTAGRICPGGIPMMINDLRGRGNVINDHTFPQAQEILQTYNKGRPVADYLNGQNLPPAAE